MNKQYNIDDYNEHHGDTWVDMHLSDELKEFRQEIRQMCKDYAKDYVVRMRRAEALSRLIEADSEYI